MLRRPFRPTWQTLLGLLLAAIGASTATAQESPPEPLAELVGVLREADEAIARGEVQIAESRYRTALLEGWLLSGALAVEAGDLEGGKAAFERAAMSAVETRRPHMALALVELQLGNADAAVGLLRGQMAQNLGDAAVRRLVPRALMAAGQVAEAIQEMKELHVLAPEDLENTYALARAHLSQQNPDEALPLLAEIVAARPLPETHVLLGRTYRDFGLYERARQQLRIALAKNPEVARAHYYLGTVDLLEEGQDLLDRAMTHFEAELRVSPRDPMANLYLGIALVERRRHEEAVPRLEVASRLVTDRADAFQFLGRSYLAVGRVPEAVTTFRRALEIADTAPEPAVARGAVDFRRRQISSLHFQLAQALRRSGEAEEARFHFDAAKEFSAQSAEGARDLLEAYFQDEEHEQSIAASTWPLELYPVSGFSPQQRAGIQQAVEERLAQVYFNLGVMRTKAGQAARAASLFAQAAAIDPDLPRLQFSLGAALFSSGRFAEATAPLGEALRAAPEDDTVRRMLALAWFNADGYDEAADLLRQDPQRASNRSLQYAYAVALVRSGRTAEAEPLFAELLADNADWPELNVLLGQVHAQENDYENAIRYLRRALELDPRVAEAHRTLGDIHLRRGELDEAEEELRAELRSHPLDVATRYTLAVVLDLNRQPEAALEILRPLLEARPDLADGRYLIGKILLARGAAEEARAHLEAAAELSPDDANIHYQLGQAYQRLGRREAARRAFDEYRRLKQEGRSEPGA